MHYNTIQYYIQRKLNAETVSSYTTINTSIALTDSMIKYILIFEYINQKWFAIFQLQVQEYR